MNVLEFTGVLALGSFLAGLLGALTGLGGGSAVVVRLANGEEWAIDGREVAPHATTADEYKGKTAAQVGINGYSVGVPATLPTGGFARFSSGVTARTFTKTSSIARTSPEAIERLGPSILAIADHEGFPAHARSIHLRRERAERTA